MPDPKRTAPDIPDPSEPLYDAVPPRHAGTTSTAPRPGPPRQAGARRKGAADRPLRAAPRAKKWTARSKEDLKRYVRLLADALGLRDWELLIDWEPVPDAFACISPVYGQKRAVLSFGGHFLDWDPAVQRATIAHELIHCHLFPATEVVRETGEKLLTKSAAEASWIGFFANIEYATDAISDAVAPLLPLPVWR